MFGSNSRSSANRSGITSPSIPKLSPNFLVVANYAMYHADNEGNGSLFSFGTYKDTIIFVNTEPKFVDKIVEVENWSIPHMLSIPI
jgi:hypothetical protein